jgi:hypothetical protein
MTNEPYEHGPTRPGSVPAPSAGAGSGRPGERPSAAEIRRLGAKYAACHAELLRRLGE